MNIERVEEYFRRWPKTREWSIDDSHEGEEEAIEFLMKCTTDEKREILKREGTPEAVIAYLLDEE